MQYEPVIGLEVHAQLLTRSKMFCACPNLFGEGANTRVCPVCSGMPGALPVLNRKAVELAVRMALATGCRVREKSVFARKNYFYPDLPKGYQISQYERPLCEDGFLEINGAGGGTRRIRIKRIHLEEDAGKSIHDKAEETLVDFNRCGTPLVEIVTEPDLRTPAEAGEYLSRLKRILQYMDVCDGNMEEGSLRCDANVSIRPLGVTKLGTKAEIKNMNSFKQVEKAIRFEIERQTALLESGGRVIQQTLLWDANLGTARPMRDKEEANDYRYFPDPDLLVVEISEGEVRRIAETLPELPEARRLRFISSYGLSEYDACVLTDDKKVADYYDQAAASTQNRKGLANIIVTELLSKCNEKNTGIDRVGISPAWCAEVVNLVDEGVISGKIAKALLADLPGSGMSPREMVEKKGLKVVTDSGVIREAVRGVVGKHPEQVKEFRAGKTKVLGFLVGEVMKVTKGKASPKMVNEMLNHELAENP